MSAFLIGGGLALLLYLSGGTDNPINYAILFVSIIAMSIFFSVHYLVLYYLLQTYNVENALEELICDGIFHQYVWNKLYRRKCICRIDFPVGKTHEDEFWTYQVFGKAKTIVKIERKLYYYFQRSGSIMGEKYNLRRLDVLEAKEQRQKYMQENYPTLAESAGINLFISCIYNGQMSLKFLKDEQRKSAVRIIQQIQIQNRPDKKTVSKLTGSTRLWIRLAKRHFWATCIVKNLLRKGF